MAQIFRQSKPLEQRVADTEVVTVGGVVAIVNYVDDVTLSVGDMGKLVQVTKATAAAVSLPQDSAADIPIGSSCRVQMMGAGQVTIGAGSGATLRKAAATAKVLAQYGVVTVTKIGANTWSVNGELAAS